MEPEITATLVLCFDTDFEMEKITKAIGLQPTSSQQYSLCRVNPVTMERNCAYWEIQTDTIKSYDSEDAQNQLLSMIQDSLGRIKEVLHCFKGGAIFRLNVYAYPEDPPALMFEQRFLSAVQYLNAKLDIVISIL